MRKIFLVSLVFVFIFCSSAQSFKECEFCGLFYPQDKQSLNDLIDGFLKDATVEKVGGNILGIVAPHAGYIYCGKVLGYSYKILENEKFDTVILLGPSHHYYFEGIAIYDEGFFKVPSGVLEVDVDTAKQFSLLGFANFNKKIFFGEHSLEVQMPFILKTLGNVKIVPVLFGDLSYEQLKEFSKKLTEISASKKILVVVSTDFSHYLKYDEAVDFDKQTIKLLEAKDDYALFNSEKSRQMACGILPLISFVLYGKNKNADIKILKYLNSGDTASSKDKVVGYVSAVLVETTK